MERRFVQQPELQQKYSAFLSEYLDMGHMSLSPQGHTNEVIGQFFLPHHGVVRESSSTTKLRVVFNGSQKSDNGPSLNDVLLTGRNLLPELRDILLRWRFHRIVFSADVEKMYRQISIHAEDRRYQQILWRTEPRENISVYQLNTVTYGLNCAPFLANRTLRQLAKDEQYRYPVAASIIDKDIYMDDVISGDDNIEAALVKQRQLIGLFTAGGFPLRKWNSNDPLLLSDLPNECIAPSAQLSWQFDSACQLLDLSWNPDKDCFFFAIQTKPVATITRRSVLSKSAQLFDPLGWLSPVTVVAKIFIQSLWLLSVGWDDPLPEQEAQTWSQFYSELPTLTKVIIPRWVLYRRQGQFLELHGFADAFERAYAAVVYIRIVDVEGLIKVSLLTAKTKVSPLKPVTLPRLELCAAHLLAKLITRLRRALHYPEVPVYLYTDAKIVLDWIRAHPSRWPTYIANRVSEIQRNLPGVPWHHVKSAENPADCASRGIPAEELISHPLWWQGPPFLRQAMEFWPPPVATELESEFEEKAVHAAVVEEAESFDLIKRFSSLRKLVKVTAWVLRFARNLTSNAPRAKDADISSLTVTEIEQAKWRLVQLTQREAFPSIIEDLQAESPKLKRHELVKLTPYLDKNGTLRVGGRLKHSLLDADAKYPIILPRKHPLTTLIIEECHSRTLHGGTQLTLNTLRQNYWILRGRSAVKTVIHRCRTCFRFRAKASQQLMGQLPEDRVTPVPRAFLHTGVDYAGPVYTRTTKGRGLKATKSYICVFVCLSTRAVHLELVSDYTSSAFIAAFQRFVSRRGKCSTLRSDCGTTFIGADTELRQLFTEASSFSKEIAVSIANDGTQWRFNPPSAPHFGGLWEAAVKSTKHHLKRVIGEATLTFEEMTTLLTQVEACLNSHPLQALSDDPSDFSALTPGHFLIGSPPIAVPHPAVAHHPSSRLSRWQQVQQMAEHFWTRWSTEYIQSLQPKNKWTQKQSPIKRNDLVLIRNDLLPPTKWALGRVVELHPGQDGEIRVVTVRTATSTMKRPIVKLSVLPRDEHVDSAVSCLESPHGGRS